MARVRNTFWKKQIDKLVQSENIPVVFKKYINFGTEGGETGYGFRDEAGIIQWKNDAGTWQNIGTGGGGGSAHVIQDEGTNLPQRGNLNFTGSGVTVTDGGAGPDSTIVTISTGGLGQEMPTGAVNGSNVTFVATVAPKFIITDTGIYVNKAIMQNVGMAGFSLSGLTITIDLAPNFFLIAYS